MCAGLDARAAAIVMRSVKNTVRTGRTVVCTIHQPSLEIFQVTTLSLVCPLCPIGLHLSLQKSASISAMRDC